MKPSHTKNVRVLKKYTHFIKYIYFIGELRTFNDGGERIIEIIESFL